MTISFDVDRGEPLGLWQGEAEPPESHPELRALALEFSSRGDRVGVRVLLPPEGEGPFPVVLLQHGATGSTNEPYMGLVAGPWARRGAAVASIDFPLHGARANAKLIERVLVGFGLAEERPGATERLLLREFVRQSVIDLRRALDVLETQPLLDAGRLAYAGLSLGSIVGAVFCGQDPRPRAAALALGGGGFGDTDVDPSAHVARIAPRPLLFVNMRGDETVPAAASEALFEAAGEPKEIHWFDGGHQELPGSGLKKMWEFLRRAIELPASA